MISESNKKNVCLCLYVCVCVFALHAALSVYGFAQMAFEAIDRDQYEAKKAKQDLKGAPKLKFEELKKL